MSISVRVMALPKAGNRDDEYEDACWPDRALTTTQPLVHGAIADGATESAFAGLWARQLVAAYGAAGALGAEDWVPTLTVEQAHWQSQVDAKALPWYAEEKARSGAFAALLGVTIGQEAQAKARPWQALSVGDCALFQVRRGVLLSCFPATTSAFFTNRPLLISSLPAQNAALAAHRRRAAGELWPGDVLYLTTDALGQWFLSRVEHGAAPWIEMEAALARRKRGFTRWIAALRNKGQLRNDDVTLLRIAWPEQ
ncbi:MAG: hypothetical protein WAU00_14105 [Caldilinea sp.]|uniref:hypothetical protein n=1 Tax=Caldilinea sp. TaxID=2293560 RepID=UPI002B77C136|nr:hypothetical protein [Anaerolineales bacterium]HQY93958.1 hypothetical protein [Caldilinea sp.]HRA64909.1 hypothetical protein [Caldilinea sp.]